MVQSYIFILEVLSKKSKGWAYRTLGSAARRVFGTYIHSMPDICSLSSPTLLIRAYGQLKHFKYLGQSQ